MKKKWCVRKENEKLLQELKNISLKRNPENFAFLQKVLENKNPDIRVAGIKKISQLEDIKAEELALLRRSLQDANEEVRYFTAWALGRIGSILTVPLLKEALQDEKYRVRLFAAESLERITGESYYSEIPTAKGKQYKTKLILLVSLFFIVGAFVAGSFYSNSQTNRILTTKKSYEGKSSFFSTFVQPPNQKNLVALIHQLMDQSPEIRLQALKKLKKRKLSLGKKISILLIDELKTQNNQLRNEIKQVLLQHSEETFPLLVNALDRDLSCKETIELLSEIGEKSVPALVQKLEEGRPINELVLDTLGHIGPDAKLAVPKLINLLSEKKMPYQKKVGWVLEQIGRPAIPGLIKLLRHEQKTVKLKAIRILSKFGEKAVLQLVPLLADESVQYEIKIILEAIGEPAIIPLGAALAEIDLQVPALQVLMQLAPKTEKITSQLITALTVRDFDFCRQVVDLLSQIGEKAVPILIKAFPKHPEIQHFLIEVFYKMGPKAKRTFPLLKKTIENGFYPGMIVEVMGKIESPEAFSFLIALYLSESDIPNLAESIVNTSPVMIPYLIEALKKQNGLLIIELLYRKGKVTIPYLLKALSEDHLAIQLGVLKVLQKIDPLPATVTSELIKHLSNESLQVEVLATMTVLGPNATEAIPELLKLLKHPSWKIRKATLEAVSATRVLETLPFLLKLLKDPNAEVRIQAHTIFRKLVYQKIKSQGKKVKPLNPRKLMKLLKDENLFVQEHTAFILQEMGPKAAIAIPALIHLRGNSSEFVQFAVERALGKIGIPLEESLPELFLLLEEKNFLVQSTAYVAISKLKNKAMPYFSKLVKRYPKESTAIKPYLLTALVEINATKAIPYLLQALANKNLRVKSSAEQNLSSLLKISPKAIPEIISLLKHKSYHVRAGCLILLGGIQKRNLSSKLIPFLIRKTKDSHPEVRENAIWALAQHCSEKKLYNDLQQKNSFRQKIALLVLEQKNFYQQETTLELLSLAQSSFLPIQRHAFLALSSAQNEAVLPIIEALENPKLNSIACRSLLTRNSEIVAPLLTKLKQSSSKLRLEIVKILGEQKSRNQEVVSILESIQNNPKENMLLRNVAHQALKEIGRY